MAVYFIRSAAGHIKIGVATDPKKRLASLQTASPFELELLGTVEDVTEEVLHRQFSRSRVRGEWFALTQDLREFLEGRGINCGATRTQALRALLAPKSSKVRQTAKSVQVKQWRTIRPGDDLTPVTRMAGCLVCNQELGRQGNLCSGCRDQLNNVLDLPDPRYPENEPYGFWQGAQGRRDVFEQPLGPNEWPFPDALVNWMSWIYHGQMRRHFERGSMFTRSTPASIRLAGPLVLRRLFEEKKVNVADGAGGGYWYARAE